MAIRPDILAYQTTNECAPCPFSFRLVGNPVEIIVAFNLIASASRFRMWAGSWG